MTRTTLLLVGKETSAYKLNHIAQIVWKCFQDGQVFGDIYTIPFILTTSELLSRIRNYRFKIYPKNSLIPADVWKYDTESILEGMHNAIAHQNYEKGARIKEHPVSADAVAMLRKRKLIEGRLPHIYVSKDIAQATDMKVEYSKHKGLVDKKCEALLIVSLKDHGSLTKQEIVRLLWDVLPDQLNEKQKGYKIDNLLRKMRKEGNIMCTHAGNKSIWSLVKE